MGTIVWSEIFPTKSTFLIFVSYMSLFIGQGILVTASQEANNTYSYNTVTVVLFTEVLKLLTSVILYCKEHSIHALVRDVQRNSKMMVLYLVPAFLYCFYNNLAFINLSTFDPTTYYLLLQLRVVITGVLFQIIFKKYLTRRQWLSLILLTIGCMVKQVNLSPSEGSINLTAQSNLNTSNVVAESSSQIIGKNITGFDLSLSALWILTQTICSCLAGVYSEFLLKDKGADVNIFVQNIFLYFDSIVCNMIVLLTHNQLVDAFTLDNLRTMFRLSVFVIIVNNAAIGLVTSFFLKFLNSILKTFASALELTFTAIFCYFLFGIPIYLNTALSIIVVSLAIYLYSQSPVVNVVKNSRVDPSTSVERHKLLESEKEEV